MIWMVLVLVIIQLIITIGIVVFLWWQFSFTDSRLCKLIEDRSNNLEDINILNEEYEDK